VLIAGRRRRRGSVEQQLGDRLDHEQRRDRDEQHHQQQRERRQWRGRHRRRLLLKTRRETAVQPLLREWLAKVAVRGGARVDVDVDPVSFL